MECNKDEAIRAKEIAEKKFTEMDISAAKKYALKAQNLYPGLDGLPQFLETLDVYISAAKRLNGEVDWYRVLGVEPLADDEVIRKRYRKLALILHPDKNKSVGADGAFKLLSEAWSLLSDKAKRIVYDQKRNLRGIHEKIPDVKPSMPAGQNGFHNLSNENNLNAKNQKSATHPKPAWTSDPLKPTFWTLCNSCKMQFEYLRTYINYKLVCPNCHLPFLAFETPPPPPLNGNGSPTPWNSYMQRQNSCPQTMIKNRYAPGKTPTSPSNVGPAGFSADVSSKRPFHSDTFSKSGGIASMPASSSSVASMPASKKAGAGLATDSSNSGSSSVQKGEKPKKRRRINEHRVDNKGKGVGMESASGSQKSRFETGRMNAAGNCRPNVTRELSQLEMRKILMEKARKEIHKKLNEWSMASVLMNSNKSKTLGKEVTEKDQGKKKSALNGVKAEKYREFVDTKNTVKVEKSPPANSGVDSDTNIADPTSMSVPDPDFHDFDKDRTEKSFGENQVWAAYDDDDGMPRYYAMIHSVISKKPFKMRISWLNSKSNNELAPLNWIGSGFSKTSGDFWIGKYVVNGSLNSFSHKVKWTKGTRGAILIYPTKGNVWALYRNWSPDWNELTLDEVIHRYDMVEVLEDYNEERGVTVAPLVKVSGLKTVFHHDLDPSKIRTIPRAEMFRFSHQVPSYLLTGEECHNAPKGCWELDPAAMPLELLQVLTEAQKEEMVDIAENAMEGDPLGCVKKPKEEDPLGCMKNPKEENLVENGKTTKEKGLLEDTERKVMAEMTMKEKNTKEGKMVVYSRRRLRERKMLESAK